MAITSPAGVPENFCVVQASEELLDYMRGILGVRSGQLSIVRGESTRQKTLVVQGMTPQIIFERLEASL